ncbi:hypothetical protein CSUI_007728 [Cystoisospora suis]|uniref:Uncharacterized protein n=1 Tax=Cystoisospora suis TaxID=483139 RepID=A0A2C6KPQ4_9APIC|nr:hypothetical protein CSUI_007728 [Cystoisospora suis]
MWRGRGGHCGQLRDEDVRKGRATRLQANCRYSDHYCTGGGFPAYCNKYPTGLFLTLEGECCLVTQIWTSGQGPPVLYNMQKSCRPLHHRSKRWPRCSECHVDLQRRDCRLQTREYVRQHVRKLIGFPHCAPGCTTCLSESLANESQLATGFKSGVLALHTAFQEYSAALAAAESRHFCKSVRTDRTGCHRHEQNSGCGKEPQGISKTNRGLRIINSSYGFYPIGSDTIEDVRTRIRQLDESITPFAARYTAEVMATEAPPEGALQGKAFSDGMWTQPICTCFLYHQWRQLRLKSMVSACSKFCYQNPV